MKVKEKSMIIAVKQTVARGRRSTLEQEDRDSKRISWEKRIELINYLRGLDV